MVKKEKVKAVVVRPLHEIANEIAANWIPMSGHAIPYVRAMLTLDKISDNYGADPGYQIVNYFLGNAQTWRGEVARRVKKELNAMVKSK